MFIQSELSNLLMGNVNNSLNFLKENSKFLLKKDKQDYLYDSFIDILSKDFLDINIFDTENLSYTYALQIYLRTFILKLKKDRQSKDICNSILEYFVKTDELSQLFGDLDEEICINIPIHTSLLALVSVSMLSGFRAISSYNSL